MRATPQGMGAGGVVHRGSSLGVVCRARATSAECRSPQALAIRGSQATSFHSCTGRIRELSHVLTDNEAEPGGWRSKRASGWSERQETLAREERWKEMVARELLARDQMKKSVAAGQVKGCKFVAQENLMGSTKTELDEIETVLGEQDLVTNFIASAKKKMQTLAKGSLPVLRPLFGRRRHLPLFPAASAATHLHRQWRFV